MVENARIAVGSVAKVGKMAEKKATPRKARKSESRRRSSVPVKMKVDDRIMAAAREACREGEVVRVVSVDVVLLVPAKHERSV